MRHLLRLLAPAVLLAWAAAPPAAAQTQLQRNPLPSAYRGAPPTVRAAHLGGVFRVSVHAVDAEGRPLAWALVRVEGAPQQLWADERGTLSLLVSLEQGPLRLTCSASGYDDAVASVARPEDNNLVFQLFRSSAPGPGRAAR